MAPELTPAVHLYTKWIPLFRAIIIFHTRKVFSCGLQTYLTQYNWLKHKYLSIYLTHTILKECAYNTCWYYVKWSLINHSIFDMSCPINSSFMQKCEKAIKIIFCLDILRNRQTSDKNLKQLSKYYRMIKSDQNRSQNEIYALLIVYDNQS